jgi:riboflavin kinase/FMN adenylyltransferase
MNPRVYRHLDEVPAEFGPCALSIGNFDGVHAGHRALLRQVVRLARQHPGWKASVLTFHPHPATVVAPARAPLLMTTPDQRVALMAETGIEQVIILPFDQTLSRLSPEEFVQSILVERLQARAVVVGHNFRFGYRAAGDTRTLEELGVRFGLQTHVMDVIEVRHWAVSSSAIREAVRAGQVSRAGRMLGRWFALEGAVVKGFGIGSRQTVPTLNLDADTQLLPAHGVYVTDTSDLEDGRCWQSVTNVGRRPTFQGEAVTVETFLLSPFDGRTPARIRVEFLWRLRAEQKFASPEALKAQIARDVARARRYFALRGKAAAIRKMA